MAGLTDIMSVQQTGVAVLSAIQEVLAKTVPTHSSGHLDTSILVQSGFVRVTGVSVVGGAGGLVFLHDCAALADAATSNRIYAIGNTPGYTATNMVFHKGLVLLESPGTTEVAIFYTRV
jgi:hypothetical protein